jgi:hypothetical protein
MPSYHTFRKKIIWRSKRSNQYDNQPTITSYFSDLQFRLEFRTLTDFPVKLRNISLFFLPINVIHYQKRQRLKRGLLSQYFFHVIKLNYVDIANMLFSSISNLLGNN